MQLPPANIWDTLHNFWTPPGYTGGSLLVPTPDEGGEDVGLASPTCKTLCYWSVVAALCHTGDEEEQERKIDNCWQTQSINCVPPMCPGSDTDRGHETVRLLSSVSHSSVEVRALLYNSSNKCVIDIAHPHACTERSLRSRDTLSWH